MSEMSEANLVVPSPRPRLWVRVLLALVIFVSGCIVGAGGTVFVIHNRLRETIHHPESVPPRIAARLQRFLDLTDEQTEKVAAILKKRQQSLQSVRREVQPRIEEELDTVHEEIAAVLDDQQRERWDEHFAALREKWLPEAPK